MIGFNVVGDKYCFEADWNYFICATSNIKIGEVTNLALVKQYRANKASFQTTQDLKVWLEQFKFDINLDIRDKLIAKHSFFMRPDVERGLLKKLLDDLEHRHKNVIMIV